MTEQAFLNAAEEAWDVYEAAMIAAGQTLIEGEEAEFMTVHRTIYQKEVLRRGGSNNG